MARRIVIGPAFTVGGVDYAPFEQIFDQQKEGREHWIKRINRQVSERPAFDIGSISRPKGFINSLKLS